MSFVLPRSKPLRLTGRWLPRSKPITSMDSEQQTALNSHWTRKVLQIRKWPTVDTVISENCIKLWLFRVDCYKNLPSKSSKPSWETLSGWFDRQRRSSWEPLDRHCMSYILREEVVWNQVQEHIHLMGVDSHLLDNHQVDRTHLVVAACSPLVVAWNHLAVAGNPLAVVDNRHLEDNHHTVD